MLCEIDLQCAFQPETCSEILREDDLEIMCRNRYSTLELGVHCKRTGETLRFKLLGSTYCKCLLTQNMRMNRKTIFSLSTKARGAAVESFQTLRTSRSML